MQRLSWCDAVNVFNFASTPVHRPVHVATYTQPVAATRGSVAALGILILTILLGTTVVSTLTSYFQPALAGFVTFVWMGVYVLAFLGLMFGHGINWISWFVRYRILLVLILLGAIVSVSWSVDARVSAERVVHLVGTTLVGVYLGYTVPLLRMLRVFASVLAVIMVASLLASLALPELGFTAYEGTLVWSGVMNSKNDLGFWAATGVLLYITLSDSTRSVALRLGCYLLAGLCLALLAFSQSATSLLAMLVAGSLSLYLFIAARFQLGFVQMIVVALMLAGLVGFATLNIDTAELVGRTDDLTGRGEVWQQTWQLILERPLTGYGYGSIWYPTTATLWIQQSLTDFTWIVYHAHNGFLQVASEVGLPVAILALLMVAQQLIEIFYCQYQRQQAAVLFVLAYVVLYLIGNYSEARFLVTRELYWIFFIALPASMLRQVNVVATDDEQSTGELADVSNAGSGEVPGRGLVASGAAAAYTGSAATAQDTAGSSQTVADIDLGGVTDPFDPDASSDESPVDEARQDETAEYEDVIRDDWYELPEDVTQDDAVTRQDSDDRFDKSLGQTSDGSESEWFDLSMDESGIDDTAR